MAAQPDSKTETKSQKTSAPSSVMGDRKLEELLQRLAEIVRILENNESSLEDSLRLYEEGVQITKHCHTQLNDAEKKIEILSKVNESGIETREFTP